MYSIARSVMVIEQKRQAEAGLEFEICQLAEDGLPEQQDDLSRTLVKPGEGAIPLL